MEIIQDFKTLIEGLSDEETVELTGENAHRLLGVLQYLALHNEQLQQFVQEILNERADLMTLLPIFSELVQKNVRALEGMSGIVPPKHKRPKDGESWGMIGWSRGGWTPAYVKIDDGSPPAESEMTRWSIGITPEDYEEKTLEKKREEKEEKFATKYSKELLAAISDPSGWEEGLKKVANEMREFAESTGLIMSEKEIKEVELAKIKPKAGYEMRRGKMRRKR